LFGRTSVIDKPTAAFYDRVMAAYRRNFFFPLSLGEVWQGLVGRLVNTINLSSVDDLVANHIILCHDVDYSDDDMDGMA